MSRAFILVMDSVGIGSAPDADRYGDAGANTLGHVAHACRDEHTHPREAARERDRAGEQEGDRAGLERAIRAHGEQRREVQRSGEGI